MPIAHHWTAFYTDSRVYDSDHYTWPRLPSSGVLGVAMLMDPETEPPLKKRVAGGDWYWMENGLVRASDTIWDGYVDPPTEVPDDRLKRGEAIPDDEWDRVRERMREVYR